MAKYNSADWQWVKIGTSFAKVPSDRIIKADLDRIDRSIQGYIVKHDDDTKVQFYDFNTARSYRDKNGGFMYPTLVDPLKEIRGIKAVRDTTPTVENKSNGDEAK
jgi:hypothetical protein